MKFLILLSVFALSLAVPLPDEKVVDDDTKTETSDVTTANPNEEEEINIRWGFPFLRVGTFFPISRENHTDGSSDDGEADKNITGLPSILDLAFNPPMHPLMPFSPIFPVRPLFHDVQTIPEDGNDTSLFHSVFGVGGPITDDLPPNYQNSTFEVKDINGTQIKINQTIDKQSGDGFDSFFHMKVIQIVPKNDTDQGNTTTDAEPEIKIPSLDVNSSRLGDKMNQLDSPDFLFDPSKDSKDIRVKKEHKRSVDGFFPRSASGSRRIFVVSPHNGARNSARRSSYSTVVLPSSTGSDNRFAYKRVDNINKIHTNINGDDHVTIRKHSYIYQIVNGSGYSYSLTYNTKNDNGEITHTVHRGPVALHGLTESEDHIFPVEPHTIYVPEKHVPIVPVSAVKPTVSEAKDVVFISKPEDELTAPAEEGSGMLSEEPVVIHALDNRILEDISSEPTISLPDERVQFVPEANTKKHNVLVVPAVSLKVPNGQASNVVLIKNLEDNVAHVNRIPETVGTYTDEKEPLVIHMLQGDKPKQVSGEHVIILPDEHVHKIPEDNAEDIRFVQGPGLPKPSEEGDRVVVLRTPEVRIADVHRRPIVMAGGENYSVNLQPILVENGGMMGRYIVFPKDSKEDKDDDEAETIPGIRPPDLSRDTRVNSIAADKQQGFTLVDPDAEVYDLSLVLKELESNDF